MSFVLAWVALALPLFAPLSAQAQQPIYRCGNSYSQEPCAGGKVVEDRLSVLRNGHDSPGTVHLCKAHGGGLFWSRQHCHQHNAFIERTESVPSGLPWEQQVEHARAQWQQAQRLSAPPAATSLGPSTAAAPQRTSNAAACDAWEQRVAMLDSMGRAGSRYYDLDWVRRERKAARDAQHRLKCG